MTTNDRIGQILTILTALMPILAVVVLFLRRIVDAMAPGKKKDASQFVLNVADIIVRRYMTEVNDRKNPNKPELTWTQADRDRIKAEALEELLAVASRELKIMNDIPTSAPTDAVRASASSVIESQVQAAKSVQIALKPVIASVVAPAVAPVIAAP